MKTIIYTQRVEVIESYNEKRDCADQRIADFISTCGYIPIPVPNNPRIVEGIFEAIAPWGIVLVGGNSLVKYGGNAPERDFTDEFLINLSIKKGIPLYGFCRGMQSILDYFGNELETVDGHVAKRHSINGKEPRIEVNSYHNQACKMLKDDSIEIIMRADDGVIEKIKHKEYPIIGTMWHPERENPFNNNDIEMVKKLFGL